MVRGEPPQAVALAHKHNRRASDGQSGLSKILALLARLLDPSFSESGGLFMGDLIIHLLRNAGDHLNTVLPQLLDALVRRMTIAKTSTYVSVSAFSTLMKSDLIGHGPL